MAKRISLSLFGLLFMLGQAAEAAPIQEYELKTAYLYNFALFTSWPADLPPELGDTMAICTLGQDQFGPTLEQLQGRKIREKRLVVRRGVNLEEALSCHVVYIAASEQENMDKVYETLRNSSVLTVSESSKASPIKSVINMAIDKKRLVFEVNLAAATQARLVMSSKLLHLAKRVY
ncbi:MAG TPA: YfiR family protein [Methylophilaceae bacterium]|nr:YfiR family protein [Methylophilaceae bacterium]